MACSYCRAEGHVITECASRAARVLGHVRGAERRLREALRVVIDVPALADDPDSDLLAMLVGEVVAVASRLDRLVSGVKGEG